MACGETVGDHPLEDFVRRQIENTTNQTTNSPAARALEYHRAPEMERRSTKSGHEGSTNIADSGGLESRASPGGESVDTQPTASLIDSGIPKSTIRRREELTNSTEEGISESDTGHISHFTGGRFSLPRREVQAPEAENSNPDPDAEQLVTLRPDRILLAINDQILLEVERLPLLVDQHNLVRQKAREIVRTTSPMSEERAILLSYLSDRAVDFSELRRRCDEALEAAFRAAGDAVWEEAPDSPARVAGEPSEQNATDELTASPNEASAEDLAQSHALTPTAQLPVGSGRVLTAQGPRGELVESGEVTAQPQGRAEELPEAKVTDGAPKPSYCCYIALMMTARVLNAPTVSGMLEAIRRGTNLDDIILNVECLMPPTESKPSEPDTPEKPGYGHVYALLGCLMATAYVKHKYAIDTVYLDRSIGNLDVAILKMPDSPFKEFRDYLRKVREEVSRIQVLFQRVELEDDPYKNDVPCAICLDLKSIIGYKTEYSLYEEEYPSHKMEFEWVCRRAAMRCRVCTLLRDATASMHALLGVAWDDIAEIRYENRSAGQHWYDSETDPISELLWGRDGPVQIWIRWFYLRGEVASLSSFELYQSPGATRPWNIIGTGTHVCSHPNLPDSWEIIDGWIRNCVDGHDECRSESEDRPFPTRIVEVGADGVDPRLYLPVPHERGRYAALSHCWGDVMPLKATKCTIERLCRGIELTRFPKTFQDAISVCRRLQLKYLWIDSLCIVQDDEDDWTAESAKMSSVYQNAFITIAAATAQNSTEGCFLPRPFSIRKSFTTAAEAQGKVEEVEIFARPWQSNWNWTKNIGDGPWDRAQHSLETRAWTLQEHLLSRRILRFTTHELVWHCRATHLCECLPGSVTRKEAVKLLNLEAMSDDDKSRLGPRISNPKVIWPEIVSSFMRRAITRESDRLEAISGVAAALAAPLGMTYVGGMWKDMLGHSLYWRVDEPGSSRREGFYAPTWSWASVVGSVLANDVPGTCPLPQTEVVDVEYTLATPNPYGRLSDAKLTIRGILIDVRAALLDTPEYERYKGSFQLEFLDNLVFELDNKLTMEARAFPDIRTVLDETPELLPGDTLPFLILACKFYGEGFDSILGILLVRVSSDMTNTSEVTYRRVGVGEAQLRNSDRDQSRFKECRADEGLAWYVADRFAAKGLVSTVAIV